MGKDAGFLLAVGAGGEFPSLSQGERKEVACAIVDEASGKVPVLVGVQHTDPRAALDLARHALEIGADGIQASPPFYYHPTESDVYDFFGSLNQIGIPIMVYNTFWEGFDISSSFLGRLVELDNIVCIKWASPTLFELKRGYRLYADRVAMIDNTASPLLSHILGARGFISHEANFWPEHELELWRLTQEGSWDAVKSMLSELNTPFYDFRVKIGGRKGGEAHVIKAALDIAGLRGGPPRPPTAPLDGEEIEELRGILVRAGTPTS
jgi:4-hydroxy-tetrahydrodipicolinate synthase